MSRSTHMLERMGDLAERAIDVINASLGRFEGHRAVHAKGTLAAGTFTATPAAAELTTAAHLHGDSIPVVVRFSNSGSNPNAPDYAREGRGFGVKFELPDSSRTDLVTVTAPAFMVRTPEDFIRFTSGAMRIGENVVPGPKLLLFVATHRESWTAVRAGATSKPPASYATCRYNSLHAYKWVAPDGSARFVRYSWLPEGGEKSLSGGDAKKLGPNYLQEDIGARIRRGPVRFTLQVQIAGPDDPTDDPTAVWPSDRESVEVGTIELTTTETGREEGDDVLVFDPTRVTAGIELSDDPILRFRADAYAESVFRRSGVKRPGRD